MKVLLISANTERFNMPAMPLGLACVAEAVKKAGHDVIMLDLMFTSEVRETLSCHIKNLQPECIGISVRNIDDQNLDSPQFLLAKVKDVVAICRDLSESPIVLGGAGYSMFPEEVLAYLEADLGIDGEGEVSFPELLTCLENKSDLSCVPGLYIRDKGSSGRPKIICRNLDWLSLPATSILSTSASRNDKPWIPVQTRRGCALKCSYCSTASIEGALLRKRSPEIVSAWLEHWVEAGYRNFFFVDNTFNLPSDYAKAICREIIARKLDMSWYCIIYPRNIDRELVEMMASAGCRHISLGFESGSSRMLKNLNKKFTLDDVRSSAKLFADQGIERMGFLLLGGPGETRESVEESLEFADSLKLDSLKITAGIRIYPDTQLAETAINQGVITSRTNLLHPHFYLAREVADWLATRLQEYRSTRLYVVV